MRLKVDVIVVTGVGDLRSAKEATATIPIVFISGSDPVNRGLVASLNRPGGNITGVTIFSSALIGKRIGLMRQLVPNLQSVALLVSWPLKTSQSIERESISLLGAALSLQGLGV